MEIRIRNTGAVVNEHEFVRHVREQGLQQDPPVDISPFPVTLDNILAYGGDPVMEAPAPTITDREVAYRNGVVQDALNNWVYAWAVREKTVEELDAAAQEAKKNHNASIDSQILALEAKQARSVREAVLTGDKTRLKALDDQITVLRVQRK